MLSAFSGKGVIPVIVDKIIHLKSKSVVTQIDEYAQKLRLLLLEIRLMSLKE
jgi:hypothetical protein